MLDVWWIHRSIVDQCCISAWCTNTPTTTTAAFLLAQWTKKLKMQLTLGRKCLLEQRCGCGATGTALRKRPLDVSLCKKSNRRQMQWLCKAFVWTYWSILEMYRCFSLVSPSSRGFCKPTPCPKALTLHTANKAYRLMIILPCSCSPPASRYFTHFDVKLWMFVFSGAI